MAIKKYWAKLQAARRERRILKDCGCVCYCKTCRNPLNDTSECISIGGDHYTFICCECGSKSVFYFGPPAPILMSHAKP